MSDGYLICMRKLNKNQFGKYGIRSIFEQKNKSEQWTGLIDSSNMYWLPKCPNNKQTSELHVRNWLNQQIYSNVNQCSVFDKSKTCLIRASCTAACVKPNDQLIHVFTSHTCTRPLVFLVNHNHFKPCASFSFSE